MAQNDDVHVYIGNATYQDLLVAKSQVQADIQRNIAQGDEQGAKDSIRTLGVIRNEMAGLEPMQPQDQKPAGSLKDQKTSINRPQTHDESAELSRIRHDQPVG